ncbi:MAG: hypothetical protein AABZ74_06900 [Cyanobacteriota bacterium]
MSNDFNRKLFFRCYKSGYEKGICDREQILVKEARGRQNVI